MIITCDQCLKKFEIDSMLIPNEGRLLQCSSCHNKWFYKKDIPQKTIVISKPPKIQDDESEKIIKKNNNINTLNDIEVSKNNNRKHSYTSTKKNKLNPLNFILVFVISVISLIVLLDTFKYPISLILPDIEFILESLYETVKDITLFIQDLF